VTGPLPVPQWHQATAFGPVRSSLLAQTVFFLLLLAHVRIGDIHTVLLLRGPAKAAWQCNCHWDMAPLQRPSSRHMYLCTSPLQHSCYNTAPAIATSSSIMKYSENSTMRMMFSKEAPFVLNETQLKNPAIATVPLRFSKHAWHSDSRNRQH
jgi:hypothetical protein